MKLTAESILSHAWYYIDRAYEVAQDFYSHNDPTVERHGHQITADMAMVLEDRKFRFKMISLVGHTAIIRYNIAHNDGYLTRFSRHMTWSLVAGLITWGDLLLEANKELKYRDKHGISLEDAEYFSTVEKITDSRFPDAHDKYGSVHVVDLGDEGLDPEQIKQVVLDVLQHNIDRDDEDREAYEDHLESINMTRAFFTADDKLGTLPFVGGCTICDVIITELREDTESWGLKELAQHFKDVHQMHLTVDPNRVLAGTGVGWPDLNKIPDSTNL